MKKHRSLSFIILLLSFVILYCVINLTIGFNRINIIQKEEKYLDVDLMFSKESGFYDDPFYLEISSSSDCKIYYTLDSSDPNENSFEYKKPIYLDNASKNDNVYSMREDVSVGFYKDLINSYYENPTIPGYQSPDYKIDKCNVVKAIAIDGKGNKSKIKTGSYFVGLDKSKYEDCYIFSINTDPDNLFGYEKGIYVTGKTFDDFINNGDTTDFLKNKSWEFFPANYRNTGKKWQRDAFVDLYSTDKELINSQDIGIRIQGGISRGAVPRSFNVYAKKNDNFYSFFEDGFNSTKMNLSAGGNQVVTKVNDYLISKLIFGELDVTVMNYVPSILFLDGEYWGFYWLASSFNEDFFNYYYNVQKENILMIKKNAVEIGNQKYEILYSSMRNIITKNDLSDDHNYQLVCNYIDEDSFVDYYAMMIYIARQTDWPNRNTAYWRTVDKEDNEYGDGRFRMIVYDCNSPCMEKDLINHNTLDYVIKNDELFASLWKNEHFKNKFIDRIIEISDTCFNPIKVNEVLDNYNKEYYLVLSESWKRFYGSNNDKENEFYEKIDSINLFFQNRKNTVLSWFN